MPDFHHILPFQKIYKIEAVASSSPDLRLLKTLQVDSGDLPDWRSSGPVKPTESEAHDPDGRLWAPGVKVPSSDTSRPS